MWSLEIEKNKMACEAIGPPVGWKIVCHSCGHQSPVLPGEPYSGGACVHSKCCQKPNCHVHDLRILCEFCK